LILSKKNTANTTITPPMAPMMNAAHGSTAPHGAGDGDETGEHAVADHRQVGLAGLQPDRDRAEQTTGDRGEQGVDGDRHDTNSSASSSEPGLNPNQPTTG
jgi:hypothetical protein